ncbi:hypothetical protein PsorP6_010022 [Peronosclerospora sorghi]|uniref:Uncharacterized protein n=1 Tax=Peronosclerospora sorghi TaxID=230839 RepID=A0ACC0VXQ1_9STRA|nr:hypothetical protein PsorP6_010022 [Peronosclerospora sorghi]
MEVDDGCVVENCADSAVSPGCCIAHGGGKRCVFEGCTTTARKGGFCFAHGGKSTSSTATNKRKMSSHTSPLAMTSASTTAESLLWPSEVIDYYAELQRVPLAARESFETIYGEYKKLEKGLASLYTELKRLEETTEQDSVVTFKLDGTIKLMRTAAADI